ncbi:MAG: 5-demethoxyubiquinol-8 5-hydroxylase UbiM [Nitrosomonadales bacterium]|nr:5-demethoxyubiquinol-8 5-hydroxylase UbiM [Nitrosomonadales bacterium]
MNIKSQKEKCVVIVGAGPAGLAIAKALSGMGFIINIIDPKNKQEIVSPSYDGREIALTHQSQIFMEKLGIWQKIPEKFISYIKKAKVLDDDITESILIGDLIDKGGEIGFLVSNYIIRKASYEALIDSRRKNKDIEFSFSDEVIDVQNFDSFSEVKLRSGNTINAKLVISSDSRFSKIRTLLGIPSDMFDFGRDMLVCSMKHSKTHDRTAWEWFTYGYTLALLPMRKKFDDRQYESSVIVTMTKQEINNLLSLDEESFNQNITQKFKRFFGDMVLTSPCYSYPLVSVYPKKFVADRYVLIGDAAVGMHPVTAHGYNFVLKGIKTLTGLIDEASQTKEDIGSISLLKKYNRRHKAATKPLYLFTKLIIAIFTKEDSSAKKIRKIFIKLGQLTFIQKTFTKLLMKE